MTTTGMGWNCISLLRKVRPSMRGISISSVSTSGWSARILSRATYGSGAVPATSMSGSPESASDRILRTMAESSTISTRVLRFIRRPPSQSSMPSRFSFRRFAVDRGPHVLERMRDARQALGMSHEQVSSRLQGVGELPYDLLLGSGVEVDHHVPAKDDGKALRRR